MATQRISILGTMTLLDSSSNVFFEPYGVEDTAAVVVPQVLVFNTGSTKDGIRGVFQVPQNYTDTANLVIVWTANATEGDVVWDWSVLTRSGNEDMGAAATRTSESVTDSKTSTLFGREEATMSLTDGDYVAGDEVLFELFRDQVDSNDTLATKALVFGVYFEYADA